MAKYFVARHFINGECKKSHNKIESWKEGEEYTGEEAEQLLKEGLIVKASDIPSKPAFESEVVSSSKASFPSREKAKEGDEEEEEAEEDLEESGDGEEEIEEEGESPKGKPAKSKSKGKSKR